MQLEDVYRLLKEDIKFSVAPKFIDVSPATNDLTELAIEVWRIEQRINRALPSLPENQQISLTNSIQKIKRFLNRCDIEIIEYTNQKFNDGLNLDVLSIEKAPSQLEPIVKETIEPTIMCKGQVIRKAKIIVLSN